MARKTKKKSATGANLGFGFDKNYKSFLMEIKSKILSAHISAARRINKELIKLYWDIGKTIVNRQKKYGWGKCIVEKIAKDLQYEFGAKRGFSAQNLWYMRQFYTEYRNSRILQQLVGELPWGHNIMIYPEYKNFQILQQLVAEIPWGHKMIIFTRVRYKNAISAYPRAVEGTNY